MNTYAQNKEDLLFKDFFGHYVGTLLSIGENNGKDLSNALAFVENGWSATLIEASPTVFPLLSQLHSGNDKVKCMNVAVGTTNEIIKFYESGELLGIGDHSLVSTVKLEETRRWESLNIPFKEILVPCVTFSNIIEMSPYKTFDFISIDIEGMELDVLPQIDFNALQTKLICVENNSKDQDKFDAIIVPFGFELIHKNSENLIYGKNNFIKNEEPLIEQIKCINGHSINGVIPNIYDESSEGKQCDCGRMIFFKDHCNCPNSPGWKITTKENI